MRHGAQQPPSPPPPSSSPPRRAQHRERCRSSSADKPRCLVCYVQMVLAEMHSNATKPYAVTILARFPSLLGAQLRRGRQVRREGWLVCARVHRVVVLVCRAHCPPPPSVPTSAYDD